ncbi:MAG: methionyl-tRNA formyltransferase [Alphaproteobacteria bacterium]|nr:methionyl-tRNA formyltransferase [Alphaproteobacteria bacterium]
MRIIVNGQAAFGKDMLDALVKRGETIVGVYGPTQKDGAKPDPIKDGAAAHGLPFFDPASFRKPEVWDHLRALKADLGVMAYVTKFVPEDFLNIPTHGTIQYHPSLLPKHRGPSSINWPIIEGTARTGLTIFWPNNGLDTGPVLLQKTVDIGPDDTLGSIYFDKLYPLGIQAMLEAVDLVRAGKAPKIVQDEATATYEGWCRVENVAIDWSKPATHVHNLIRGANPQPGAWTRWQGKTVQIYECTKRIDRTGASGAPGEVVAIEGETMTVAAVGGAIVVSRVRAEGGKKIAAAAFAAEAGIAKGAKLG